MSTTIDRPTQDRTALRAHLREVLDGARAWARDEVRAQVLADPAFAPVTTDLSDEAYRQRVLDQLGLLADKERGTSVGFPESVGGENDIGAYVTAFETLAMGDLSLLVKAGVQFGLFGGAIHHLGSPRHHERYLPQVVTCELLGGFAMTETGHGSNVQQLGTTATFDPDTGEFVIHTPDRASWKDYIGNALHAGAVVVFAQLHTRGEEHGVHAFVVPIRDPESGELLPGVSVSDDGHKGGLNGVDNGRLAFDHVRIDADNLLDRLASVDAQGIYDSPIEDDTKRFFTTIGTLVQGRISIAGAAIGASKRALTIAVRYATQRRQFGPPDDEAEVHLLDYRMHQRRLLPRVAATYALQAAQTSNVDQLHRNFSLDEGSPAEQRELEARAAGMKAIATWHASDTIQECREACGGAGYLAVNLLPQLKADTDVFTTFEGDNTVLLQLVAKELLTEARDDIGSLDALGTARFFADLVADLVVERTAARRVVQAVADGWAGRDPGEGPWPAQDILDLLAFRTEHQLSGLLRRLRAGVESQGREPFEVFNECQDHVVSLARASVEQFVAEEFAGQVADLDGPAKPVLDTLVELHGMSLIETDRAWFLEHGRLSASRAKGAVQRVNELCADLRPHALDLVEAFGVPEAQLTAPIAQDGAGYAAT